MKELVLFPTHEYIISVCHKNLKKTLICLKTTISDHWIAFMLQVNEQDVEIFCDVGNNVEEGIVNLIYENNIKKLIIGAAADSRYSE